MIDWGAAGWIVEVADDASIDKLLLEEGDAASNGVPTVFTDKDHIRVAYCNLSCIPSEKLR